MDAGSGACSAKRSVSVGEEPSQFLPALEMSTPSDPLIVQAAKAQQHCYSHSSGVVLASHNSGAGSVAPPLAYVDPPCSTAVVKKPQPTNVNAIVVAPNDDIVHNGLNGPGAVDGYAEAAPTPDGLDSSHCARSNGPVFSSVTRVHTSPGSVVEKPGLFGVPSLLDVPVQNGLNDTSTSDLMQGDVSRSDLSPQAVGASGYHPNHSDRSVRLADSRKKTRPGSGQNGPTEPPEQSASVTAGDDSRSDHSPQAVGTSGNHPNHSDSSARLTDSRRKTRPGSGRNEPTEPPDQSASVTAGDDSRSDLSPQAAGASGNHPNHSDRSVRLADSRRKTRPGSGQNESTEPPEQSAVGTAGSPTASGLLENNPRWLLPFKYGWTREIVKRNPIDGTPAKTSADAYYFAPCGKKLRSMPQISDYISKLSTAPTEDSLTMDCFTFLRRRISNHKSETDRQAGPAHRAKQSGDTPVEQADKQASMTPKTRKRANDHSADTHGESSSPRQPPAKRLRATAAQTTERVTVQPFPNQDSRAEGSEPSASRRLEGNRSSDGRVEARAVTRPPRIENQLRESSAGSSGRTSAGSHNKQLRSGRVGEESQFRLFANESQLQEGGTEHSARVKPSDRGSRRAASRSRSTENDPQPGPSGLQNHVSVGPDEVSGQLTPAGFETQDSSGSHTPVDAGQRSQGEAASDNPSSAAENGERAQLPSCVPTGKRPKKCCKECWSSDSNIDARCMVCQRIYHPECVGFVRKRDEGTFVCKGCKGLAETGTYQGVREVPRPATTSSSCQTDRLPGPMFPAFSIPQRAAADDPRVRPVSKGFLFMIPFPPGTPVRFDPQLPFIFNIGGVVHRIPPRDVHLEEDCLKVYIPIVVFPRPQVVDVDIGNMVLPAAVSGNSRIPPSVPSNSNRAAGGGPMPRRDTNKFGRYLNAKYSRRPKAMPVLQNEMILPLIFEYLPLSSLMRAYGVCRLWRKVIDASNCWFDAKVDGCLVKDWRGAADFMESHAIKAVVFSGKRALASPWSDFCEALDIMPLSFGKLICTRDKPCPPDVFMCVLKALPQLRSLDVFCRTEPAGGCSVTPYWRYEEGIAPELMSLALRNASSEWIEMCPKVMPRLEKLTLLTTPDVSAEALRFIRTLDSLEELELGPCTNWSEENYEAIGEMTQLADLKKLSLRDGDCSSLLFGLVDVLVTLGDFPDSKLASLQLVDYYLTGQMIDAIRTSPLLHTFEYITQLYPARPEQDRGLLEQFAHLSALAKFKKIIWRIMVSYSYVEEQMLDGSCSREGHPFSVTNLGEISIAGVYCDDAQGYLCLGCEPGTTAVSFSKLKMLFDSEQSRLVLSVGSREA